MEQRSTLTARGAGIRDRQAEPGAGGLARSGGLASFEDDKEAQTRRERLISRDFKKKNMKQRVPGADGVFGEGAGSQVDGLEEAGAEADGGIPGISGDVPVVVAFADFDPPASHESQMLSLRTGDEVYATGQDGQGWWYGRKRDGTEGWFPPSYVQLKEEANAAAAAAQQ